MKAKILFLLKSQVEIDNLKNSLFQISDFWDLSFFINTEDALASIAANSYEVVFSDYRHQEKNGSEFFSIVNYKDPRIFRILFFNEALKEKAIRTSNITHRLLKSNCGYDEIVKTLNELKKLKKYNLTGELVSIINSFGPVPVLPELYLRLEKELNKPDISVHRLAEIISLDPLMVAKILHIANSSFCIFSKGINNLVNAVNVLGTNIIKTLVLYIKVFALNNVSLETQAMLKRLRSHSIETAKIAKSIVEIESMNRELVESAYITGLIHDIGKIILLQHTDKNIQNKYTHEIFGKDCLDSERRIFGVTHVDIGAYILGLWGFPEKITDAIASHHDPLTLDNEIITLPNSIYLSNSICNNDSGSMELINSKYGEEKVNSWKRQLETATAIN